MDDNTLATLIDQLDLDAPAPTAGLPDIDLYMDQLISLIETQYHAYRRHPDDKLLTKTMVNNYSKNKMLGTVHKKKYNRGQMLMITLIFKLKAIASIDDIKTLFQDFSTEDGAFDPQALLDAFPGLDALQETVNRHFRDQASQLSDAVKKEPGLASTPCPDSTLLAYALYLQALNYKRLADALIDSNASDGPVLSE